MKQAFNEISSNHPTELRGLVYHFLKRPERLFLRSFILDQYRHFEATAEGRLLAKTGLGDWIDLIQEGVRNEGTVYFATRPAIAVWEYYHLDPESLQLERVSTQRYLEVKESLVLGPRERDEPRLEIDLRPFEKETPKMEQPRSIGKGVQFLNRHLAGRMFAGNGRGVELLIEFLHVLQHRGRELMLGDTVTDSINMKRALQQASRYLERQAPSTPWTELEEELSTLGFEPGWGKTAADVAEKMHRLLDLIEAPDPVLLESFLSGLPMIFNLVILSPHGFFGQSDVLGKPDTGGQVVYILDQVRALEAELIKTLDELGLDLEPQILVLTRLIPEAGDTHCDVPEERVHGTQFAKIIRVPFREESGEVIPHWISRFKIWPHLEGFAREAEREILARLGGRPDLIVGNYSDGNLVATMLAQKLDVTQCNIAHALEKTKYLYSDVYWKDHEEEHGFSCQYTADLIAMNSADFIITSTYQEIAGTEKTLGQYESYNAFTLPGLYRVLSGIDPYSPKFNIVSPGADPKVFHDYRNESATPQELADDVADLIHGSQRPDALGEFSEKTKPILFAMSRLDQIKNITGLVDWYGGHNGLREQANLLVVGGQFDPAASGDSEERQQIELLHDLIERHELDGQLRWVQMQTNKLRVGELYRNVARHRGAFVQPARFEAFGLTVIEAMTCGLPVFATLYGGPLEIVVDGKSGFHIDPNEGSKAAARMCAFFERCGAESGHWDRISEAAMQRVESHYTWKRYATRMLSLSRIFGFWKYMSNLEQEETRHYISMFYHLMHRPLASS